MAQKAGTERVMSDKINWLYNKGHSVIIVTYEQGNHPVSFLLNSGVKIIDLNTRFFNLGHLPLLRRLLELRKLRTIFAKRLQKVLDDEHPDIIVTTTYSLKIIDIIARLNSSSKKIVESHAVCYSVAKEFDFRENIILKHIARLFDKFYLGQMRKYDLFISLTKGDSNDWRRYVDNILTIPNPLTFYPSRLPVKKQSFRILCVGRLTNVKGFDLLINSYAKIADKFPKWYIDIYGDGEDREILEKYIKRYRLEKNIHLCGSTSNIYEEYCKSDFFVLSSRNEGFGLVLIEAMSCACPCVSFRCKYGPEDIITDGVSGLLVKDGDINDLADKMAWMMSHDKERIEMGKKARKIASNYQLDKIMQRWEKAYLSVL